MKTKIKTIDLLKSLKKSLRETTHMVKPKVEVDKRKKLNKNYCRKNK